MLANDPHLHLQSGAGSHLAASTSPGCVLLSGWAFAAPDQSRPWASTQMGPNQTKFSLSQKYLTAIHSPEEPPLQLQVWDWTEDAPDRFYRATPVLFILELPPFCSPFKYFPYSLIMLLLYLTVSLHLKGELKNRLSYPVMGNQ